MICAVVGAQQIIPAINRITRIIKNGVIVKTAPQISPNGIGNKYIAGEKIIRRAG